MAAARCHAKRWALRRDRFLPARRLRAGKVTKWLTSKFAVFFLPPCHHAFSEEVRLFTPLTAGQ
ncbi:MAG TPA: hypothetical protein VK442_04925 [Xanthobacteraceae bacterium]|nr:hypothetical protein [Xanthobacteraceae bacterium]